jgi:hypothetical protein
LLELGIEVGAPDGTLRPGDALDVGYTGRDGYDGLPLAELGVSDRGDEACTDGRVPPCVDGRPATPRVAEGAVAAGRDELGMLGRLPPMLGRLLPMLLGRGALALDARGADEAPLEAPPRWANAGRLNSRALSNIHDKEVRFMGSARRRLEAASGARRIPARDECVYSMHCNRLRSAMGSGP